MSITRSLTPTAVYNVYATNPVMAARRIQDRYLAGKKIEAMAAAPDKLVEEVSILGPRDWVKGELERWKDTVKKKHVSSMRIRKRPCSFSPKRCCRKILPLPEQMQY